MSGSGDLTTRLQRMSDEEFYRRMNEEQARRAVLAAITIVADKKDGASAEESVEPGEVSPRGVATTIPTLVDKKEKKKRDKGSRSLSPERSRSKSPLPKSIKKIGKSVRSSVNSIMGDASITTLRRARTSEDCGRRGKADLLEDASLPSLRRARTDEASAPEVSEEALAAYPTPLLSDDQCHQLLKSCPKRRQRRRRGKQAEASSGGPKEEELMEEASPTGLGRSQSREASPTGLGRSQSREASPTGLGRSQSREASPTGLGRSQSRNCQRRRKGKKSEEASVSTEKAAKASSELSVPLNIQNSPKRMGGRSLNRNCQRRSRTNAEEESAGLEGALVTPDLSSVDNDNKNRLPRRKPRGERSFCNKPSPIDRMRRSRSYDDSIPPLLSITDLYSDKKNAPWPSRDDDKKNAPWPSLDNKKNASWPSVAAAMEASQQVKRLRSRDSGSVHWSSKELRGRLKERREESQLSSQSFWVCAACNCEENKQEFIFCVGCGTQREVQRRTTSAPTLLGF